MCVSLHGFVGYTVALTGYLIFPMLMIDTLAEQQIEAAIRDGELDDLPGMGHPLVLDDDSAVPESLRVAYRILRNAGCLPPEQTLRREIHEVEQLLHQVDCDVEEQALRRRLNLLKMRLAVQGKDVNLLIEEGAYREKLLRRFGQTP